MLSPLSLEEMICLAEFEEGQGKKDLKICQYSRRDYVRLRLIVGFLFVTAACGMILLLAAAANINSPILTELSVNPVRVLAGILIFYIISLAFFLAATWYLADTKYREAEERVRIYEERILKLLEFSDMEER